MGGATPGQLVLDVIRKQAEQAIGSKSVKQHSFIGSASVLIPGIIPGIHALTFVDDDGPQSVI